MKKYFSIILVALTINTLGQAYSKKTIRRTWRHIPSNIEECINKLDTLFNDSAKIHFLKMDEKTAVSQSNFFIGMSLRNNWKLWRGSILSKYFNNLKVYNPEDMTYIILTSYHRKLNNKVIDFDGQLKDYYALVDRMKTNPPKPVDNFHVGDTVLTNIYGNIKLFKKQPGYSIKAIVLQTDTTTNKFKLRILSINRTETKGREEVSSYIFDNQTIFKDYEFWTGITWWRKEGQIIHIDVTY